MRAEHSRYLPAGSRVSRRTRAARPAIPALLVEGGTPQRVSEGRKARDVPDCANLPRDGRGLLVRDRVHPPLPQAVDRFRILAQVELGPDEDDGDVGRVVADLRVPLERRKPSSGSALRFNEADHVKLTLVRTFSKLGGLTTEKQMRKTSV